jgi:hypothetical protein
VTLADTPNTWLEGPFMPTLEVLAIFAGIPLLVILAISLLVYGPSWVHGPRYRPGQPWESKREWFGASGAADPSSGLLESGAADAARDPSDRVSAPAADPDGVRRASAGSGGASADW